MVRNLFWNSTWRKEIKGKDIGSGLLMNKKLNLLKRIFGNKEKLNAADLPKMELNKLTLTFQDELEKKFQKSYFKSSIGLLRLSFLLGLFYYSIFAFLDAITLPEVLSALLIVRFAFVCPFISAILILSFTSSFEKWWQFGAALTTTIAGVGIVIMTVITPDLGRISYYPGIMLVLSYGYMLIKLRFIWSTLSGWLIYLAYVLSLIIFPGVDPKIITINLFFLTSANILGMFGGYALEYYTRKEFFFRYLLKQESVKVEMVNSQLEENVAQKTKELRDDIKKRQEIEKALKENETKYRNIFENSPIGIVHYDQTGTITDCNEYFINIIGSSAASLIGFNMLNRVDNQGVIDAVKQSLRNGIGYYEGWYSSVTARKNTYVNITFKGLKNEAGQFDSGIGLIEDITHRKQIEQEIELSLKEKNLLLRELYHRTKNNMQVIASMLKIQSRLSNDTNLQIVMQEVVNKINAMSLVHQKLYEAQNLSRINLKEYIEDFMVHLIQSYEKKDHQVILDMDLQDVSISVDAAVPLGLVITELISNVFKHAFPTKKDGVISIHLEQHDDKKIRLIIADNGIGPVAVSDLRKQCNMGLNNVFSLIEYQLQGKVFYQIDHGLKWEIIFRDDNYKKRI